MKNVNKDLGVSDPKLSDIFCKSKNFTFNHILKIDYEILLHKKICYL